MPKPKPIRTRDNKATHPFEMARRYAERNNRIPHRESRVYTTVQIINGVVTPIRRITMWDGIRVNAAGIPRSKTYRYLPPLNALGEPRR